MPIDSSSLKFMKIDIDISRGELTSMMENKQKIFFTLVIITKNAMKLSINEFEKLA